METWNEDLLEKHKVEDLVVGWVLASLQAAAILGGQSQEGN